MRGGNAHTTWDGQALPINNIFILYRPVGGCFSLHHVQAFFIPSPFKDDWIKAMNEEINKLKERGMWKQIKRCFVRIYPFQRQQPV